ncbi:MAG: carboxypeptidase regulatory-like domain-containing protein [Acidobacteriota bacterium]|nr:carboxypeptidase regulatory-like domain-containing protein [Acidobacteriota bacterium]
MFTDESVLSGAMSLSRLARRDKLPRLVPLHRSFTVFLDRHKPCSGREHAAAILPRTRASRLFIAQALRFRWFYVLALWSAGMFLSSTMFAATVRAGAASIKGTVRATTAAGTTNARSTLLSGATLTLANRELPSQVFKTTTDDAGSFIFINLPAATYLLTAEASGLPSVTRDIKLTSGATLNVEIELTPTVSESVTVREEEGLLSTAETTTSNIVRTDTLLNVPLRAENYQSALPLTPGVVRGSDGLDHVKGARAGQSAYTVNGADITDPVTGNLAFDIPIEAAASVQIEENPYGAEFGRFTGGVTNLETKGGGDKFKIAAARFFPTFHNIFGGRIDSFRPRVTFSGPVIHNRLYFLQSFEYRFSRAYVPSQLAPRNNTSSESFNSFTQLDLTLNKNNRVKFVAALFPQKIRYVGLNSFNPQSVTPNYKQRGMLFSISEQAIFSNNSFLLSGLSYKTFSVDVFGQGAQGLTLTPDINTGNYFADTRRRAPRLQWQETYYACPFKFQGEHSFKLGMELDRTNVSGTFSENSIFIRRLDNTLAQRIDFVGAGAVARHASELTSFAQDRWVVNPKLTIDAGVRFDRDGIARQNNFSPRFSLLFLPLKNDRTIIRGGIGLFYDRTPFGVGYFTQLPERVVTRLAPDGLTVTDGPRLFNNTIDGGLRNPRSVRWSLQLDRGITKNLTARVGYLERRTTDDFLIEPRAGAVNTGALVLSSRGRSRYRELQLLATYNKQRLGNWNASYTWSSARGDLNTVDNFLGDFPAFVVRSNEYAPLSFDAPHRLLVYGQLKLPHQINVSPTLEIRSGFPYSRINEQLEFAGGRNLAGRFPKFLSLDVQVTKGFNIPGFVPMLDGRHARIGVAVFNFTNHFNPRDVQQNATSPRFGQFFNSLGTSVRGKFEIDF